MTGSEAFWSHWGWPLATAVLGFVYAALVFRQWLQRRKPHQMAWTVGLLFYAVAAVMEFWSEFSHTWDPTIYRVYIVLAASMVGFLGLGTLYLMSKNRMWPDIYLGFNLGCLAVFTFGALTVPLLADKLVPGITVGGQALGAASSFPRVMSLFFNIPGTIFLLGGALLSIFKFMGNKAYRYRMWGNVLIALGTIIIATVGSRARAGVTVGLYPAEMVASALLLWGFLVASTLEKGAQTVRGRFEKPAGFSGPAGEEGSAAGAADVQAPDAEGAQPSE